MTRISRDQFQDLFSRFERSAWRLETQGWYDEPDEGALLAQWLADPDAGAQATLEWFADWPELIVAQVAEGKRYARVRVLTEPPTDYLRWQLGVITAPAVAAGEDIRVLPADTAAGLTLGAADFWLFDDSTAAVLDFEHGQVIGADLIAGPAVEQFRAIRATAWDHALRFEEYQRRQ
ncbi:DUF6879 family protein [Kutzneria albida]|uniref:DUF6879 domain-containing protein n=1 Tax=Kutzneria albida DSM 43870 TaxID=1449976 RepID=W5WJU3_9PSEU|nr:DUF6879 family protein [Kutzneria albida]AHH98444.1 hypothetical protein KALB_5082 [Kutzneria albida DSM 43870]